MTPEEAAKELYWKLGEFDELSTEDQKKCCNIALDLVIKNVDDQVKDYWQEVKNIINKRGL